MMTSPEAQRFAPEANRRIFDTLFAIEVALRELIIETLATDLGARWVRHLPKDVREKSIAGRESQRRAEWTTYVEHHPLYYVDFPDLGKVLSSKWNPHFAVLFSDRDVLLASLRQLEPIRNKIAHNRKATDTDLKQVTAIHSMLLAEIGTARFATLTSRSTTAPPLTEIFDHLLQEIRQSAETMVEVRPPVPLKLWPTISDQWWLDSDFLFPQAPLGGRRHPRASQDPDSPPAKTPGSLDDVTLSATPDDPLEHLRHFFWLYQEYSKQPRGRGLGHALEQWSNKHCVSASALRAAEVVERLQKGQRDD